jgi:hypothetical protein
VYLLTTNAIVKLDIMETVQKTGMTHVEFAQQEITVLEVTAIYQ